MLPHLLSQINLVPSVNVKTSLESAIITSPEARDKDLVKKLEAVAGRLLNSTY